MVETETAPGGALWDLSGLCVEMGGRRILAPLSLSLPVGRVYGLIGPNGSGKSTLMRVLARQLAPSGGAVSFAGRPLRSWSGRDFARNVAYMPQFTPPSEGMTVRELVALGRYPWHGALGRFSTRDGAAVDAAMERTGLTAFGARMVDSLSGGERQRVWLALMLAQEARCLLLDEPTSALDIAHQMQVLTIVRELVDAGADMTVLVVLHDINMAVRTCDTLIALKAGELVAHGPAREIMEPATLRRIYELEMGIVPHPVRGEPMGFVL